MMREEARLTDAACPLSNKPLPPLLQCKEVLERYTGPSLSNKPLTPLLWYVEVLERLPSSNIYTPPTSHAVVPLKYLKYLQTLPSYQTYTLGNPPLLLLYLNTVPHQTKLCFCTILEGAWRYFTVLASTFKDGLLLIKHSIPPLLLQCLKVFSST